ncbi:hydroxyisourate hydrolase [Rhizobiaceae bacterium]|nr:hydroxyisourate hydrolase [Rhizobiaceae bacterium]
MGKLTTHVLDTATGRPAADMAVRLYLGDHTTPLVTTRTNADGRCDAPLLDGAAFGTGTYRLEFDCGPYFDASGVELPSPKFLDTVTLNFGIAEDSHYHVPLLVSPFGYSTYRGS